MPTRGPEEGKALERDEDAVEKHKVCAWPSCQCELGGMCDGAVANAFVGLSLQQEKLAAHLREVDELLNSRMPRGRL